jgi:hypothetical protein
MHHQRMYRTGSYELKTSTVEERFWAKVDKNGPVPAARPDLGSCWIWTASPTTQGYGQFRNKGLKNGGLAHRAAWLFVVGPLTPGLHLDHLCKTLMCVRAALDPTASHLEEVTRKENILRGDGFGGLNSRKTHCVHGHEYTEENTVWENGWRKCRTCRRAKDRARNLAKKGRNAA